MLYSYVQDTARKQEPTYTPNGILPDGGFQRCQVVGKSEIGNRKSGQKKIPECFLRKEIPAKKKGPWEFQNFGFQNFDAIIEYKSTIDIPN
jgi:hypothetical protein